MDALQTSDPFKKADIGMSSSPRPELQPPDFTEFVVALDAVAIIVHPDNPVNELTLAELKIFLMRLLE